MSKAWYDQGDYWLNLANNYIIAYQQLPQEAPQHVEVSSYKDFAGIKLIFESNCIENAGLSESETRKVILDHIPEIPSNYNIYKKIVSIKKKTALFHYEIDELLTNMAERGIDLKELKITYSYSNKTKEAVEVLQHYGAYFMVVGHTTDFMKLFLIFYLQETNQLDIITKKEKVIPMEYYKPIVDWPDLYSEDIIKNLHYQMAKGIMPKDSNVEAGEYRIDSRAVGFDTLFLSPQHVPDAMRDFVDYANDLQCLSHYLNTWEEPISAITCAAKISHKFVRIHPFPDFNGRISRLLLMMSLYANGVPFALTLRSTKKDRHRYLRALKFANNGNYNLYEILIAMNIVKGFQDIDNNLEIAGYKKIFELIE